MSIESSASDWSNLPGRLIVVSGPSGSGKTSIVRRVVARPDLNVRLSVSATTRPPRPGEENGREYFFLSRPDFEAASARGELLEWAEVHGNLYGTPAAPVREALAAGRCEILEIDVQGGQQIIERYPATILVFVDTSSFAVLEERLRSRHTEDELSIQRRLANARREIEQGKMYHHRIINEDLDRAVEALASLLSRLGCGGPARDA
jgi:guanylate kinase